MNKKSPVRSGANADSISLKPSDSIESGLVTLAFLTSWADEPSCIAGKLDIFAPIVTIVLCKESPRGLRFGEIQSKVYEYFGLSLPQHIISKVLSILMHESIVLKNGKAYSFNAGAEVTNPDLLVSRNNLLDSQNLLVRRLVYFCSEEGHSCSEEDVRNALARFLLKNCTVYVTGRGGDVGERGNGIIEELVARYLALHGSESDVSDIVTALARGSVFYSAAFLGDWNQKKPSLSLAQTSIYLDTPIILYLLDFDSEEDTKFATEAVSVLQGAEAEVRVFDSTLSEVNYILQSTLESYDDPEMIRRYRIHRAMQERGVSKSELAERADLVETALKDLGIDVASRPTVTRALSIDELGLRKALEDRDSSAPSSRVDYDVRSIEGILTLRGNREPVLLSKCNAVLATTSGEVIGNVSSWWRNVEGYHSLPPVLGIRELANYAWFIHPTGSADMPLVSMLASCAAALRPSDRYWLSFVEHVEKHERLREEERVALLESDAARTVLRRHEDQVVNGDVESIDYAKVIEDAKEEVIERPKRSALSAQEEELRTRHEREREDAVRKEREANEQAIAKKLKPFLVVAQFAAVVLVSILLFHLMYYLLLPSIVDSAELNDADTVLGMLSIVVTVVFECIPLAKGYGPGYFSTKLARWLVSQC